MTDTVSEELSDGYRKLVGWEMSEELYEVS
jgi:hypothetical protein